MKHSYRYQLLICFILSLSFILSGCAKPQSEFPKTPIENKKTELNVWIFFDHNTPGTHYNDLWKKLSQELGYTVNVKTFASEELKYKLRIGLACDELPDIFAVWGGTFPDFLINADTCLPIQEYIKNSGLHYKESYLYPYADGNNYIIPCLVEAYAVTYYNKSLMKKIGVEPPKTWDDLMNIIYAVNDYNQKNQTNYSVIELGDKDNWLGELLYDMIVNRIDPYALDKLRTGKIDFDDKIFLDAAYKVVELVDAGAFPKDYLQTGEVESIQNFIQNKSLLLPHQSTIVFHLMENMGNDAIGLIQWPNSGLKPNSDYGKYLMDINHTLKPGLAINQKTAHKDEAAKICLKFSEEVNKINVTQYGYLNLTEDATLTPPTNLPLPVKEFTTMVDEAKYYTSFWYSILPQNEADEWRSLTKKLFAKVITPEEFIKAGAKHLAYLPKK
jgi:raffinose/stachyose/melibiose transport system substrate-binding protein